MKLNSFCFGKSNILFVEAFLGVQVQMVTGSEQVAQLPFWINNDGRISMSKSQDFFCLHYYVKAII